MKKIRILSLIIVAILVCAMLAGCESALSSVIDAIGDLQEQQGQENHENQSSQEKVETDQVIIGDISDGGEGGQYNVIVNDDGTITYQFGSGEGGMQAVGGFGNLVDGSIVGGIFGNGTDIDITVSDKDPFGNDESVYDYDQLVGTYMALQYDDQAEGSVPCNAQIWTLCENGYAVVERSTGIYEQGKYTALNRSSCLYGAYQNLGDSFTISVQEEWYTEINSCTGRDVTIFIDREEGADWFYLQDGDTLWAFDRVSNDLGYMELLRQLNGANLGIDWGNVGQQSDVNITIKLG